MNRRTKIVCTLGPAVNSPERLRELVAAGMNVARINCSHGDWQTRESWIRWIREISDSLKVPIAVLLDLQGPKFRLGILPERGLDVKPGQKLIIGEQLPIPHPEVIAVLEPGKKVLTGDGDVSFKVSARKGEEIELTCITGGNIRTRQGVTVVGVSFDVPALTKKDIEDLRTGLRIGVDYLAISYVKKAEDVALVTKHAAEVDANVQIIAKIEMRDAVKNIEDIVAASGGAMVARGDLGLQMPIEDIPLVQKRVINLCRTAGKPVITATQMMESMIQNPRPTRAETTDIANAILDGTDAIMLSGETAFGKYPIEAVAYMDKIAAKTEQSTEFQRVITATRLRATEATEAVAQAAVDIAHSMKAKAILCFSTSGFSARMVSKFRPKVPILCATFRPATATQCALLWGVRPLTTPRFGATEEMIAMGFSAALERGILKEGDLVVITAGVPIGLPGNTNLVTLLRVQKQEKQK